MRHAIITAALVTLLAATAVKATPHIMTMPYRSNLRISPFSNLSQPTFEWIDGATVSIDVGYNSAYDRLYFDYEGQFPITATFNTDNGVLYLTGTATSSEYTDAIASVVFFTTAAAGARRQLSYSLGANTFYFPLTEHYYRYYSNPGITWTTASSLCAASSYFGMPGYLATITSQDEQNSVGYVATFDAWLGGNDVANFGTYTWVSGPEQGRVIWTGQSVYAGGVAPENGFTAWNRFQPENPQGTGQDYMYLVNSADQATTYWAVASDNSYVAGYICEYGAPNQTLTVQLAGGSIELVYSCSLFTTVDDCTAESTYGCQWSTSTNQCVQSTCSKYNAQTDCVSDSKCAWDTTSEIGVCTNTQCSSLQPAVCANNPLCIVGQGGLTCRPAYCSERTTPCACSKQDGCLWRNGNCASSTMVDCNGMDVVFVVDASAEMANPYGRYPQGFFGVMQALIDTDFFFNGNVSGTTYTSAFTGTRVGIATFGMPTVGVGASSNGHLTSNRAQWTSDIQGLQQSYSAVAMARNVRDALVAAQNMFDGAPNRTRVIVILAAGGIVDAQWIRNDYKNNGKLSLLGALQSLGVTIIGGAMESSSSDTINGLNAATSLALLTDGTATTVKTTTISLLIPELINGMCIGTSLSQYLVPGKVSIQCSEYADAVSCNLNSWCAWDPSAALCQNNLCLTFCTMSTCNNNEACSWDSSNAACLAKCPALAKDACLAEPTCSYDYPTAHCELAPCVSNPNEDACIADNYGCTWFASNSTPCQVTPCQTADATSCAQSYGCVFNGVDCVEDPCHTLVDPTSCAKLPQCGWNQDSALCQRNLCGMHATERQCAGDFNCVWNMTVSPAACGPRMCTSFNQDPSTAQAVCQLNSDQCIWQTSGQTPRCVVKTCELMLTSCDCATVDGCLWRNETCQRDSFAQCPPTDIVFLVEATPVMNDAFGRHPNGYVGIVEAIREWSQYAPFSWSPDAPGFRFALIEYGQGNPLYVPPSIGGGGALTNASSSWVGAGQELDWNEDNEKVYAGSGQSGYVQLRPALNQALTIFNTDTQNSLRKKLVVILGNSPITDGGSAMLKQITQLELLGVKIFANVIRRFSYVTDLDTTAENYMRPIASDPPSTFFSFTTIDTMTADLLDTFCDPSSKTGKFLQVSRNGELPCSWLTGSDECNAQGLCSWNSSAAKQCPQSGQCPTLGCATLPTALANLYTCDQCKLVSGAITCSRSNPPAVEKGLCQISTCAATCSNDCTNSPGCEWVPDTLTCERHVCSIYSTLDSCNSQAGCVWQDVVGQASCQKTPCSRLRDKQSCQTYASSTVAGYTFLACFMNNTVTPNVCMAYRCPMLQKGTCPGGDHSACQYDSSHDFCANKQCQYASAELCDLDATCYWDWYHGECFSRSVNCVLAPYSDWTPCSATCGNAYTYKTRAILQFPDGGSSCASVATIPCTESSCAPSDKNLTIIQTCTAPPTATKGVWIPANPSIPAGEWPSDCAVHCASYTIRIYCMRDSSCAWDGLKCVQTQFPGCKAHWTKADCLTSDMCDWDETYGVCQQSMQVCPYTTPTDCTAVSFCSWRTGVNAQVLSNSMGIPLQLVNPGQTPIFPFSTLASSDETVISGAVITIEGNYQRGKDTLVATFANKTTIQWIDAAGTLSISGLATVSEYFKTIRFITFTTTSTRTVPRTITWSLGNNTAFSSATMNHYKAITNVGASYGFAEADCARRSLYGLQGYLATITSQSENDLVSMKLFGDGWISGGDASGTTWQFTSGPTKLQYTFWNGPSVNLGGNSVGGHYSNWSPPNATNLYGEPIINTGASASGNDRVYLAQTGYWESRPFDTTNSNGYICEFGGMPSDVPPSFPLGGAMMVGIGGCVATNCIWHATQSMCTADIECAWNNGVCQLGCNALATQADCSSNSLCRWSTAILPPVCEVDPCASLAQSQCQTNTQCHWSATKQSCAVQTGCGLFVSQTACQASKSCYWSSGTCLDRGCATFTTVTDCRQIPKCRWDDNTQLCADQFCLYATQALCDSDSTRCDWNLPEDSRTMTFVPKTGTAYPFQANVDPCGDVSTTVNGITVAITAGMQANADVLSIDPTVQAANNYAVTYDGVVGIMKITVNSGTFVSCADAFNFMADAVQFSTTSASILTRTITYALQANTAFSVSTQTYYTAMSYTPTSFSDAQQYCAATGLFGLQGSLAVLSAEGDAQLVAQLGTTGWIAASSNAAGVWSWTTASGSMVPFWNGTGSLGVPLTVPGNASQLMFSIWDMGEPSLASSYGYVGIGGYWKAVLPGSSGGVICSYGSTTQSPTATISGFRKAAPGGCFVSMCKSLGVSQCVTNGQCRVQNGACEPDTRCQAGQTISECSNLALCYWDYSQQACLSQQPDACNQNTMVSCLNNTVACKWDPTMVYAGQSTSGFCVSRGCAIHPTSSPCKADPLCLWNSQTSTCYARLCGWTTEDQCWADPLCVYQNTQAFQGCTRSPCAGYSASACSQHDSCSYVKGECTYQRCSTTLGSSTCLQDKSCVFINNKCTMPACNWTLSQAACAMVPNCYFSVLTSQCLVTQCPSFTSLATCEKGILKQSLKPCIWDNGACRQPTAADAPDKNQCHQQVNGNMWWLWVFLAVILVLLGMILHRLYLAYAGSGNIFEPTRRNYKYNPHEKYAAAIVDHANERNEDSNVANVL